MTRMLSKAMMPLGFSALLLFVGCSDDNNHQHNPHNQGGFHNQGVGPHYQREGVYGDGSCATEIVKEYNDVYVNLDNAEFQIYGDTGPYPCSGNYPRQGPLGAHPRGNGTCPPGSGACPTGNANLPRGNGVHPINNRMSTTKRVKDLRGIQHGQHPQRNRQGRAQQPVHQADQQTCDFLLYASEDAHEFLERFGVDVRCHGGNLHQRSGGQLSGQQMRETLLDIEYLIDSYGCF